MLLLETNSKSKTITLQLLLLPWTVVCYNKPSYAAAVVEIISILFENLYLKLKTITLVENFKI